MTAATTRASVLLAAAVMALSMGHAACASNDFFLANYFPNWAQYRQGNFGYRPSDMAPVVDKFSYVVYAFVWLQGGCTGCQGKTIYEQIGQCKFPNNTCSYFASGNRTTAQCPAGSTPCTDGDFSLVSPEPADPQFYQEVVAFKQKNPNLKVLLSVGGWNFPSSVLSTMVSSASNRQSFINSCQQYMTKYGFDGIDLDWEYWCSAPREDHIKIDNTSFINYHDAGGSCPDDAHNLLTLVQEMRQAFGPDKMITLATQADIKKMADVDIASVSKEIDYWHLMDYDYSVSDLPENCGSGPCFANFTAPNQPLDAVKSGQIPHHDPPFPSSYWSVNYTVQGYKAAGAPPEKLVVGLAFYGHHWYIPNQPNWKRFGVPASISGKCHGPFAQTYGAWAGRRAQLCGLLIYSEIVSLIDPSNPDENFHDPVTRSDIGYIKDGSRGGEELQGATPAAVSWNSIKSMEAITEFAKKEGLAGVFAFDASMDDFEDNYPVVNALYNAIHGGGQPNQCDPSKGCNVCSACCKSYLHDQKDCDDCVKSEC